MQKYINFGYNCYTEDFSIDSVEQVPDTQNVVIKYSWEEEGHMPEVESYRAYGELTIPFDIFDTEDPSKYALDAIDEIVRSKVESYPFDKRRVADGAKAIKEKYGLM